MIAGTLVVYLNIQGAWLVAAALAGVGVYFASAISFWAIKNADRRSLAELVAWHDRWRNWREERANASASRRQRLAEQNPARPGAAALLRSDRQRSRTGGRDTRTDARAVFAALFGMKKRAPEPDPVDEIPAFQRAARTSEESHRAPSRQHLGAHGGRIRRAVTPVPAVPAANGHRSSPLQLRLPLQCRKACWSKCAPCSPDTRTGTVPAATSQSCAQRPSPSTSAPTPKMRTVTVAPKNVSGFKLPPSTLLNCRLRPAGRSRR